MSRYRHPNGTIGAEWSRDHYRASRRDGKNFLRGPLGCSAAWDACEAFLDELPHVAAANGGGGGLVGCNSGPCSSAVDGISDAHADCAAGPCSAVGAVAESTPPAVDNCHASVAASDNKGGPQGDLAGHGSGGAQEGLVGDGGGGAQAGSSGYVAEGPSEGKGAEEDCLIVSEVQPPLPPPDDVVSDLEAWGHPITRWGCSQLWCFRQPSKSKCA